MVKNQPSNVGDAGDVDLIPGLGKPPGEGNGKPTPVFLPEKFHGRRSLVAYGPWCHKELSQRVGLTHISSVKFSNFK